MIKELKDIAVWHGRNMWFGVKSMPKFRLETPVKEMYEHTKDDIKTIAKAYKSKHS